MKFVPVIEKEESKSKSYYKYVNEPLHEIRGEEEKKYLNLRPDPSLALRFGDRAKLQTSEYEFEPEGVYITKDSGIIISTCVEVPDLTEEMLDWFSIWHQLDPLRYAIWNPEDHYDVKISEEDRKRFLDDSIPIKERAWGTTCQVYESMNGDQPELIDINFYQPSKLGFKDELVGTETCKSMVCSYGLMKAGPFGLFSIPVTMAEIVRKGPNGTNVWIGHWWIGCGIKDGQDFVKWVPSFAATKVAPLIVHNHKEIEHLNKILPKLYNEYRDKPLDCN